MEAPHDNPAAMVGLVDDRHRLLAARLRRAVAVAQEPSAVRMPWRPLGVNPRPGWFRCGRYRCHPLRPMGLESIGKRSACRCGPHPYRFS